jgi:hypothetical protein
MNLTYWLVVLDMDKTSGTREAGDRAWPASCVHGTRSDGATARAQAMLWNAPGKHYEAVEVVRAGRDYREVKR